MMHCGNLESELLSHNLLGTKRTPEYDSGGGWGVARRILEIIELILAAASLPRAR
jgi:hypothetical protein